MSSDALSRLKAFGAALFWGISFVATKAALREISPVTLIVLRFAMGIAVLALAVWRLRILRPISRRDFALLTLLGFVGVTFHQALQITGLTLTSASSMAWLVALSPAFTMLLAWLFISERLTGPKILGLVIAFTGAILVVTKGNFSGEMFHVPSTGGDLLALASALNWAVFSVASKPLLKRLPPTLMILWVMVIGWVLILPVFFAGGSWMEIGRLTMAGWLSIGFLGFFCSGLAYLFWYDALAEIDASQVAAFIYLEPLVTVVVAALVLSEGFTPATFLGGLTILAGVYLVNRPAARPAIREVPFASE